MEKGKGEFHSLHERVERSKSAKKELFEMLDKEGGHDELQMFFNSIRKDIQAAGIEETDERKLELLLEGVEKASTRYLGAVIEHYIAIDRQKLEGEYDRAYMEVTSEKDASRRVAHNSFLDTLTILIRNAAQFGVPKVERYGRYAGAHEDQNRRKELGKMAIIHSFNRLMEAVLAD
jgi:hypothetical protein